MKLLQIALSLLLVLLLVACASVPDKTLDEHKPPQDVHKTVSDVIRLYRYFTVGQLVGVCGNIEKNLLISE